MKRKFISICIALVLVLTLGLVTAVPVAAASILNVPGAYTTIQEAITAASAGDTILVAAGIYEEDLVIPVGKDNLELMGASGAIIKGQATFPGEFPDGIPNIEILSSGVKIHGFTIEGPGAVADEYSMGMYIGAADVEIYDNAFLTHTQSDGQYSVVIQTYREVVLEGVDISGLNIHDNTFTDVEGAAVGYDGIFVNLDIGTGLVTIADNDFTGSLFRAISVERSNVVISGNSIITDLAPYALGAGGYQGIYIGCFLVDGNPGPLQTDVSIIGNTVGGVTTSEGFVQGIRVGSTTALGFSTITVSYNTVRYNTDGIVVKAPTSATVGVAIKYNNIVDNTRFGLNNATTDDAPIDATLNWWGTTVGTEIMPMVNGNVDYSLWLGAEYSPSAVTMSAEYIYTPPVIGISVFPASVDFGAVEPGVGTAPEVVTVTNEGTVDEDFSTSIINESHPPVYANGLATTWTPATPTGIAPAGTAEASLVLTVPGGTAPGTYTATLVFWAEETP